MKKLLIFLCAMVSVSLYAGSCKQDPSEVRHGSRKGVPVRGYSYPYLKDYVNKVAPKVDTERFCEKKNGVEILYTNGWIHVSEFYDGFSDGSVYLKRDNGEWYELTDLSGRVPRTLTSDEFYGYLDTVYEQFHGPEKYKEIKEAYALDPEGE